MDDFKKALAHERWANRRVLSRLRELPGELSKPRRLLARVLAGINVWATRLRGEDSSAESVWPDLTLGECGQLMERAEAALSEIEERLRPQWLDEQIAYTNQHGLSYTTAVRDILTHLSLHGAHHRGQISLCLRDAGHEPVNTDFITHVREAAGQPWKP